MPDAIASLHIWTTCSSDSSLSEFLPRSDFFCGCSSDIVLRKNENGPGLRENFFKFKRQDNKDQEFYILQSTALYWHRYKWISNIKQCRIILNFLCLIYTQNVNKALFNKYIKTFPHFVQLKFLKSLLRVLRSQII